MTEPQSVQAYISPPIAAVFLLGIAWRRVNAQGALAALLSGFVVGAARLVAELNASSLDGMLLRFAEINFLHFAVLLFAFSATMLVGVSLLTAPPPAGSADMSPTSGHGAGSAAAAAVGSGPAFQPGGASGPGRWDLALTIGVVAAVAGLWLYFS